MYFIIIKNKANYFSRINIQLIEANLIDQSNLQLSRLNSLSFHYTIH